MSVHTCAQRVPMHIEGIDEIKAVQGVMVMMAQNNFMFGDVEVIHGRLLIEETPEPPPLAAG